MHSDFLSQMNKYFKVKCKIDIYSTSQVFVWIYDPVHFKTFAMGLILGEWHCSVNYPEYYILLTFFKLPDLNSHSHK